MYLLIKDVEVGVVPVYSESNVGECFSGICTCVLVLLLLLLLLLLLFAMTLFLLLPLPVTVDALYGDADNGIFVATATPGFLLVIFKL